MAFWNMEAVQCVIVLLCTRPLHNALVQKFRLLKLFDKSVFVKKIPLLQKRKCLCTPIIRTSYNYKEQVWQ